MVKVSVLVPICNVEMYLEQCLSSLSGQDMKDIEIICLNDGSTDRSSEIARKFEHEDTRFRVIDKENSGYGKTMNLGLSLAKGEYIGIVESDDFIEPNMFSYLYERAKKYDADVVKSAFWVHTNGYDAFNDVIFDDLYDQVLSSDRNPEVFDRNPSIWSNLYRREFLEENNIRFFESPGASFQDIAWRVKVFAKAQRAVFVKKAFYHYRRDNMNASVRNDGKLFCVRDEYDEAERFLTTDSQWDERYKYLLPYLRWVHYCWNCFERWLSIGSRWEFFKAMRDEFSRYEEEGLLKRGYWNKEQWLNVNKMLCDSRQFFYDCYVSFLRKSILTEGFFPALNIAPKLAIYGAGKVGREALAVLSAYGKPPACFVVTDMGGNEEKLGNIPVMPVDALLPDKEQCVVLIAVTASAQPEIFEQLLVRGFKHIVAFLPEFRQILR